MRRITFLLACLLASYLSYGQRHLKGVKQIEVAGGLTGVGYYGSAGYLQHLNNKTYLQANLFYEIGKLKSGIDNGDVSYSSYSILPQVSYAIWKSESIFLNGKAGIAFGLEQGNLSNPPTNYIGEKTKKGTFLALVAGVETEIYLSDRFAITPYFQQWLLATGQNRYGDARYNIGLAIRFGIF